MTKINTYLIHGALGSGKTTLLKKLIQSKIFNNVVVIENEYANYNFDKDIISGKVKIYDISGGCICCSSERELFNSLNQIAKNREINTLFIETTGVASSIQLIKQFLLSSEFDEHYQLTRNIYILDALEDSLEIIKSEKILDLIMADIIILNKIDLVSKNKINKIKNFIETVSDSQIIITSYAEINPNIIHSEFKSKADKILLNNLQSLSDYFVDHSKTTSYQVFYPTKQIKKNDLIKLIKLLKENPDIEIARIKGIFTNKNGRRFSINFTQNYYEIAPIFNAPKNDVLIIIGKNIIRDNLKEIENQLC
jgi:G3E family GTPase